MLRFSPRWLWLAVLSVLSFAPSSVQAQTTHWVCAAADATCGGTPAYATPTAALAAAVDGDTIKLKADETFTGNFILPDKGAMTTGIVITTTASSGLPAAGYRANPTDHAAAMPNLQAPVGGEPALRAAASAQDYTLKYLEFLPNPVGYNEIVQIGTTVDTQQFESQQPRDITIDSCLVRGDPIVGQKLGIDLNGAHLTVKNSWVDRIQGAGQDAIAIRFTNGTGPITIYNNYLESTGENFLTGGSDPQMSTWAEVSAGTTTTATLTNFRSGHDVTTLKVGQLIAVLTSGGTVRRHTYVTGCGTTTLGAACSSNDLTFTAIPEAPSTGTGSDIRWGAIVNGVTFRRNYVKKQAAWMNPILTTPTAVTYETSTASGTLPAGSYYFKVVARRNSNVFNIVPHYTSLPSTEIGPVTLTAPGTITLSWTGDTNASHYWVFRGTSSGGQTGYIEVAHSETPGATIDGGTSLTTASIPSPRYWDVKNLWELKFATNVQADSNIYDTSFASVPHPDGSAIWIKANNQSGGCEHCQTKDVNFEKSIIRHVAGGFLILGRNTDHGNAGLPPKTENLTIRNVLLYDSNSSWLAGGAGTKWAITTSQEMVNFVVDHNTFIHHMHGLLYMQGSIDGFTFTNNLGRHESYGIFCVPATTTFGTACLNQNTVGGVYTFSGNAVAGVVNTAHWPGGTNDYPSVAEFETSHFTSYGSGVTGDYSLQAGSDWNDTATDGTDRGADIALVMAATNGVEAGAPEGVTPITITSTSAPPGTDGVDYTFCPTATTTTGPYTWTLAAGALPGWASMASATGCITGTPDAVAVTSFTLQVADSQASPQSDTQPLSITIHAAPTPPSVTTSSPLDAGTVALAYETCFAGTGGTSPYGTWTVTTGSLPTGLSLGAATGCLTGVPRTAGVSSFSVRMTDAVGTNSAAVAYSLTIDDETFTCGRARRWNNNGAFLFRQTTAPGTSAPDCAMVGDGWMDTSTAPPTFRVASGAPLTWEAQAGSTASHALFSTTHADTIPTTPTTDGCIPTTTSGGQWSTTCPGAPGTVPRSTGSGWGWTTTSDLLTNLNASNITTGVLASARGGNGLQRHSMVAGSVTTTDPPVGGRELGATSASAFRGYRNRYDTENVTQVALYGYQLVACAAGVLRLEYWTGSNWAVTGAEWNCTATDLKEGAFVTLPVAARAQNTQFRMWYTSGDGSVDPIVTTVQLQFR